MHFGCKLRREKDKHVGLYLLFFADLGMKLRRKQEVLLLRKRRVLVLFFFSRGPTSILLAAYFSPIKALA